MIEFEFTLFSSGCWSMENDSGYTLFSSKLQLGVLSSIGCGGNKWCFAWKALLVRMVGIIKVLLVIKGDGDLMFLYQGMHNELTSPMHCIFEFFSTNESGLDQFLEKVNHPAVVWNWQVITMNKVEDGVPLMVVFLVFESYGKLLKLKKGYREAEYCDRKVEIMDMFVVFKDGESITQEWLEEMFKVVCLYTQLEVRALKLNQLCGPIKTLEAIYEEDDIITLQLKDVILIDKEVICMGSEKWDANDDVNEPGHILQIQLEEAQAYSHHPRNKQLKLELFATELSKVTRNVSTISRPGIFIPCNKEMFLFV